MNRKPFIVFEGLDGCGKTTQLDLISQWLHEENIDHLKIREPGSTPLGEQIRYLLKNYEMNPFAELLLFNAARTMLLEEIQKKIDHKWILCDRFNQSTWAYQHYGRSMPAEKLQACEQIIELTIKPDLVVFFEHRHRNNTEDRLETLSSSKILKGYKSLQNENWLLVPKDTIQNTFSFISNHIKQRFSI